MPTRPAPTLPAWLAHPAAGSQFDRRHRRRAEADGSRVVPWTPAGRCRRIGVVRTRSLMVASALAGVTWLTAPSVAAAINGWSEPIRISGPVGRSVEPVVAIDASGAAVVAWRLIHGLTSQRVQVRAGAAGGPWSPIGDLTGRSAQDVGGLHAARTGDGGLALALEQGTAFVAVLRPGAPLSAPIRLSPRGAPAGENPRVGLGPDGSGVATWLDQFPIRRLRRADIAADGTVSAPSRVPSESASCPRVAVGPSGLAVIAWLSRSSDGTSTIRATVRRRGAWEAPRRLSTPDAGGFDVDRCPEVAIGSTGEVVVAWTREIPEPATAVEVTVRGPDGRWSRPRVLSDLAASQPRLAIDGSGTAVVVWRALGSIHVATRPRGGEFGPATSLDPRVTQDDFPELAVSAAGHAVVVWERRIAPRTIRVIASVRPPGGGFGPARPISPPHRVRIELTFPELAPQVAVGDDGRAIVTWSRPVRGVQSQVVVVERFVR